MWKLNKPLIYIVHFLFASFLILYFVAQIIYEANRDEFEIQRLFSYFFYGLILSGFFFYIFCWIYAFLFSKLHHLLMAKFKYKVISVLLTSILLIVFTGLIYYLAFYEYYQNPIKPIGAPEDYFNHISAYKDEIFALVNMIIVSIIISVLYLVYGTYSNLENKKSR